jgi:hypothetical protein
MPPITASAIPAAVTVITHATVIAVGIAVIVIRIIVDNGRSTAVIRVAGVTVASHVAIARGDVTA